MIKLGLWRKGWVLSLCTRYLVPTNGQCLVKDLLVPQAEGRDVWVVAAWAGTGLRPKDSSEQSLWGRAGATKKSVVKREVTGDECAGITSVISSPWRQLGTEVPYPKCHHHDLRIDLPFRYHFTLVAAWNINCPALSPLLEIVTSCVSVLPATRKLLVSPLPPSWSTVFSSIILELQGCSLAKPVPSWGGHLHSKALWHQKVYCSKI